jgi:predicted transcriptional regulator
MTQTQTLIEQVRAKMDGATDYKIAQALDIPTGIVHYYVKGDRAADSYTCARIAEILEQDPLEIIAQVEAEAARTEKKREYWRSFFSGMKRKAHVVALSATCGFFVGGLPAGNAEANPDLTSHNVYYVKYNI